MNTDKAIRPQNMGNRLVLYLFWWCLSSCDQPVDSRDDGPITRCTLLYWFSTISCGDLLGKVLLKDVGTSLRDRVIKTSTMP